MLIAILGARTLIIFFKKFIMFVLSDFLTFTNFVYLGWVFFQLHLTSIKEQVL